MLPVAAVAVPAIIQGLGSLFGGMSAAKASRDAAKIQAASVDKAIAYDKEKYTDSRNTLAPWELAGSAARMKLADALGLGRYMPNVPEPRQVGATAMPMQNKVATLRGGDPMERVPLRTMGATPQQGSGMVIVQAPNGERRAMTQQQASRAAQLGARIVGRA